MANSMTKAQFTLIEDAINEGIESFFQDSRIEEKIKTRWLLSACQSKNRIGKQAG